MIRFLPRLLNSFARKESVPPAVSPLIYLPEAVATATAHLIASYGNSREQHEGIAYWAGILTGGVQVVTTVLAPEAITTKGSYKTSIVANAAVITKVNEYQLQLLAQIHGHPKACVSHSAGDDSGAFMPYTGFYSLVVPHYGRQGLLPLYKCGVHRYEDGRFVQLTPEVIERQFVLAPTSVDLRY